MLFRSKSSLKTTVDQIGNMFGKRQGSTEKLIAFGSHLDTVNHGGRFDGSLGVLAALEVMEVLNDHNIMTAASLSMVNFTNEEGARFTPDMMGSMVVSEDMKLEAAWLSHDINHTEITAKSALEDIGYLGDNDPVEFRPDVFLELHIEQGPTLDRDGLAIGIVEKVQGIKWLEFTIKGQANHAGPTPMNMRHDAGLLASRINVFVRDLTHKYPTLHATGGFIEYFPNQINIIPGRARIGVDLRSPQKETLEKAESDLIAFVGEDHEGVQVFTKKLTDVSPVDFDAQVVDAIEEAIQSLKLASHRMTSGASHDAQLMAGLCPTAMIFIPSKDGISHDTREFSTSEDCVNGANVLLHSVLNLARIP